MKKLSFPNTDLSCVMQMVEVINPNECHTGIISRTDTGFRFEEAIRKGRPPRNPKLYDGEYVSLVRMVNGKYEMHAKTMRLEKGFDPSTIAFGFYQDVINALKIID